MRYFIDSEFIDTGESIDLISIGVACEDGRELYLQSAEFEPTHASDWVKQNVFPHLERCSTNWPVDGPHHVLGQCAKSDCAWRRRSQIAFELSVFMDSNKYGKPELYGWCSAYDYVALCQFFGTMMDLPAGWPHYIRDIQQALDERGIADEALPPQPENAHNALADARYIKLLWDWLRG